MSLKRFASALCIIFIGSFLFCDQLYAATPTASLKVNGVSKFISVPYKSALHLTWTTTGVASCTGSWIDGKVAVNGSLTIGGETDDDTFTLTCISGNTTVTSTVYVAVAPEDTGLVITFTANQDEGTTTIDYNATSTLEWNADNSIFCSQIYTGTKPDLGKFLVERTYGTKELKPLTNTQTYYINCESPKGKVMTADVTIIVNPQALPTASITADDQEASTTVSRGATTTLAWDSTDTNSCVLFSTGTGSSAKPLELQRGVVVAPQNETIRTVNASAIYTISCGNSSGVATSSVEVDIDDVEDTPTEVVPVIEKKNSSWGLASVEASTCFPNSMPIRYGSRDKDTHNGVSTLQTFLNKRGLYKGQPTGFAGKGTILSIQLFQKGQGISPTGFAGPQTWAKIKKLGCQS